MDRDLALARKLQAEYDKELSLTDKKKSFMDVADESTLNLPLTDPSLEYKDPTPDIHRMFVGFDKRFFWSSLGAVEVMWSPRMTSCAGICRYRSGSGATTVHLSLPLLKLRPRKDLVETLLHEMIHAYLFVTKNNKDRDGHGPEFQSHMHRINKIAGTHITIYHSFHAEVRVYKTHWWRCNGPCQHQKPFYGMVKRSMNRAPGPNDFWYADHQRNCGGAFIKIREPENFKSKKTTKKSSESVTNGSPSSPKLKTMQDYFKTVNSKPPGAAPVVRTLFGGTSTRVIAKTGSAAKTVATESGQSNKGAEPANNHVTVPSQQDVVPFSGKGYTLGKTTAPVTDKPWLKRFNTSSSSNSSSRSSAAAANSFRTDSSSSKDPKKMRVENAVSSSVSEKEDISCTVACPVCNMSIKASEINEHLDQCLSGSFNDDMSSNDRCVVCNEALLKNCDVPSLCSICEQGAGSCDFAGPEAVSDDQFISCPMCEKKMNSNDLERHLEICIVDDECNNSVYVVHEDDDDDVILLS